MWKNGVLRAFSMAHGCGVWNDAPSPRTPHADVQLSAVASGDVCGPGEYDVKFPMAGVNIGDGRRAFSTTSGERAYGKILVSGGIPGDGGV
jgi:hypothetical protein